MGNSTSSNDEYEDQDQDDEQQQDNDNDEYAKQFDGIDTLGYRVLGVQPDSPASKAGLVSFFDFIVGANEKMLLGSGEHLIEGEEYDDIDFPLLLKEASESKTSVTLLVWNIKIQEKRIVQLYPNNDWGGAGLLGVTIKLDNYGGADERLVRVLEIMDDIDNDKSPAFLAGLQPMKDFLLGTTSTTLTSTDILSTILQCNINQIIELYVYNTTTDVVRIVTVHPTYNWGNGDSILGAVLGTGYLHRLPQSCRTTIGKSIERKVSINSNADNNKGNDNMNMNFSQDDIKIEPTLEMEIDDDYDDDDDDDDDVGLAKSNHHHQERTKQPHQLGIRTTTNNSGMDDSMRSISLEQQSSSEQEEQTESDSGRRSQTSQQQQQRPDPPPSTAERIELAVTVAAAATQHKQGQHRDDDPPTSVKELPPSSFTNAILNFVAPIPIPDADKTTTTTTTATTTSGPPAAVPPAVSELLPTLPPPSEVADTVAAATATAIATATVQVSPPTQTKTFVVEQPPIVSVRPSSPSLPEETEKITAVLSDSLPPPPPKVMDQLPVTALPSFPSAAPVAFVVDPLPLPQQQQLPPPPTTITGSAPFPPPPPAQMDTPPISPPPPPPAASPDPPSKHNDEDDYDDDDDDGSEYTDGSYTDDEYTDGEESPIKDKKTTGFLASFMPPPPKMEY